MTTGGVTTVIDRLERAGYARRRRSDKTDRRRVLIEVTDLTRRVERDMFGELMADDHRLAASYTKRDLAIIKDFLERSGAQLTASIERMAKRQGR
jgi:DNA-binding MarR family transcriptional regulator